MTTITNATISETIAEYTDFARKVASNLYMADFVNVESLATSIAYATIAITGCGEVRTTEYGSAIFCNEGWEVIERTLRELDEIDF